jgi:hypothetical protein
MQLEGSCHCGVVRFSLKSRTPYPYMQCYCTICRKTAGAGGYAINIMGEASSFRVTGEKNVTVYRARANEGADDIEQVLSPCQRHFCRVCGSALWVSDPRWPELIHPFASAIDTPLPKPPEHEHIMLESRAPWVEVPSGEYDRQFPEYPDDSIEEWHRQRSLTVD